MKRLFPLFYSVLLALLSSCSSETFNDKYSSGVVMTVSGFYQTITIGNTTVWVTIDEDNNNSMFFHDEPIYCKAYGTGFFVDKNGLIATNAHNINPWYDYNEDSIKNVVKNVFLQKKDEAQKEIDANNKQIAALDAKKILCQDESIDQAEAMAAINRFDDEIERYRRKNENGYKAIIKLDSLLQQPISLGYDLSIHIIYNGDVVESEKDLYECKVYRTDNAHDLALIKLADDEETPKECAVLEIEEASSDNGVIEVDDVVYMIGFNDGVDLGETKEGYKSQMTRGYVSQLTDETEFLYSIPTLNGSSGSPILNKDGKVVGVHHAGYALKQGFNSGIYSKWLKKLLRPLGI